ncbi:MAG: hypothetical protein ACLPVY_12960 [Acidimicrobiia bacterium]
MTTEDIAGLASWRWALVLKDGDDERSQRAVDPQGYERTGDV